jgi:exodeoxyribonuclease VII large subunit
MNFDFSEFDDLVEDQISSLNKYDSTDPANREIIFSVSDFVAVSNDIFEKSFPSVLIEGEVSSFKINQKKFVFFDLKDEQSSLSCFMTVWQMRFPLEDGMKIVAEVRPKLTDWGKFSLTVEKIIPKGEGSLKKSFDILKQKLAHEGLFDKDRKRDLPQNPQRIAVISSTQAAGFADFVKIINERWSGLKIHVAHTQVQGMVAADQIIRAIEYFNSCKELPEVIAIIRGGGSTDDLAIFNDERLVRAVAASRVPIITGIGHEIDESLCDLAADYAASTPSNVAQILSPDKLAEIRFLHSKILRAGERILENIELIKKQNQSKKDKIRTKQAKARCFCWDVTTKTRPNND